MMTTLLMVIFFVLLLTGAPIAVALGLGAFSALLSSDFLEPITFVHKMVNGVNSFTIIAVPLYILAGNLCGETGLAKRLVRFCTSLVGHIPGGTGLVNVLASMFFGGISGSAVADTAAIGGMIIPAMVEEGYDVEFSGGITIASSTIGILIPPSIPQCMYGLCAGVSIGALFMGGLIPGILVGLTQMFICYLIAKKRHYPKCEKATTKERLQALRETWCALLLPAIIMVGCSTGVATATEIGAVAVLYALFVGVFVYKEFSVKQLPMVIIKSAVTSAIALLIVGVASVVSYIINMERIPAMLVNFFEVYCNSAFVVILLINLILFMMGCFMDLVPIMILFAPIFLPVVQAYGINPVQFGVMMTINLGIGLLTPPVGNCLFIGAGICKRDIISIFKASLPFAACNVFILIMVTLWQPLTTWLPSLLGY